jgi:ribosomal protein L32
VATRAVPRVKVCQNCGERFETVGKHRVCKYCRIAVQLDNSRRQAERRRRKEVGRA